MNFKQLTTILIASLLPKFLIAQTNPFGVVSNEEITLTSYKYDPDANAVILFDLSETDYFENHDGYLYRRVKRHTRKKILTDAGLDEANIFIRYASQGDGRTEEIIRIKVSSYNMVDGSIKVSTINPDEIYDEKINEYWRAKRFAIPGVKAGTIIEYSYEKLSPFSQIDDWYFQSHLPTLYSKCIVRMVPFYQFQLVAQRVGLYMKQRSYEDHAGGMREFGGTQYYDVVTEFEMEHIPAFYDDDFVTSKEDYLMKIIFQASHINHLNGAQETLITTWPKLVEELLLDLEFGRYVKSVNKKYTKNANWLKALNNKTTDEKLKMIVEEVKASFKVNDFLGKNAEIGMKEFEKSKTGNVANINLYLVGMLQAAGLNAHPVILSTRSHGKVYKKYPFSRSFNYVLALAEVNGKKYLLDGTESTLPYNLVPPMCINDVGLVVKPNYQWIDLGSSFFSKETEVLEYKFDSDSIEILRLSRSNGYDAYNKRNSILSNKEEFEQSILLESQSSIGTSSIENLSDVNKELIVKNQKVMPTESFENKIYLSPIDLFEFSKNPLVHKKREYPVDFIYKRERNYVSSIKIPDGFEIEELPDNFGFENDLLAFQYNLEILDKMVRLEASYKLKEAIYAPDDYVKLKNGIGLISGRMNKKIVFKKI